MSNNLNVKHRTIFCRDNLEVLGGINSNSIDLIYLDPPFNKKKVFTAPIGTSAEGAGFSDIFRQEDIKDDWVSLIKFENYELYSYLSGVRKFSNIYNYCYLTYMAIRLIECKRVLKQKGTVYLHCDPTMSHYLKIVLDCIFGEKKFKNEIIWHYTWGVRTEKSWNKKHDVILMYGKSDNIVFNALDVMIKREGEVLRRLATGVKSATMTADNAKSKDKTMALPTDVWNIPTINGMAKERTGYPTQKPLALLERIIKASTNKGDVVLDPFCGCATTCVAAEKLNREWIGIDISIKAYDLIKQRLDKEIPAPALGKIMWDREVHFSTTSPDRSEDSSDGDIGYVYVISNPAWTDSFKVGIARDVNKRLANYQTSAPKRDFKIEDAIPTLKYKEIEKAIFELYEGNRDNEWVTAPKEDIIATIRSMTA